MIVDEYLYTFGELNIIAKRPNNRITSSWFMKCPDCGKEIRFYLRQPKMWVSNCVSCKLEFTITPSEYYTKRNIDFSKIIGKV